ncbi:MAG TPA: N-acetylgalactosamine-6-sulfatase [Planctomycetaceae bacterium]|nr:N-acetylgalactosamine-6-sulfatase [Planctomycetaceae bacterium]
MSWGSALGRLFVGHRRAGGIAVTCGVLAWLVCGVTSCVSAAERPNIVVFLVDDMGVMDSSVPFLTDANGRPKRYALNDYFRTPSMERLAASGIRFSQFYAMSVCSPTRISIMTGQNAARHQATNWINPSTNNGGTFGPPGWDWKGLASGETTLPGILREAGYTTMHVGKGHFGPKDSEGGEPLNLGFDINIGGAEFGAPGSYYGEKNYGHGTRRAHHAVPHLEAYHGSDTFLTEALTIEMNKQLEKLATSEKPFYLYCAHYAVHAPFDSDPRFAEHYVGSGKPKNAQAFATLIEGMDKSLGDLLDHLDELGVAEDTLVLFLGDNGSDAPLGHQHEVTCAAPLRGKKGAHYEGGMRVPLIASWAKRNPENALQQNFRIPADAIQTQLCSVVDILPTVLDAATVDLPTEHVLDGRSLRTLIGGKPDPEHPQEFLMHYPHGKHRSNYFTTFRRGDWKVVYHAIPDEPTTGGFIQSNGERYQLFNLADDPFESQELSKSHPDQLRRMMGLLVKSLEEHDALYPVKDGKELRPKVP